MARKPSPAISSELNQSNRRSEQGSLPIECSAAGFPARFVRSTPLGPPAMEITFRDFSNVARRRGHTPESLAAKFRGKIDEPREFFERVMSCKHKGEDRSQALIPYRSVIDFYRQEENYFADSNGKHKTCACGCRCPVFDRKKWAAPACRKRAQRANVPEPHFAVS